MTATKKTQLLDTLNFPEDIKELGSEDLELLAQEIRTRLLEIGDFCGGHLASNLGVVELTIVLHVLFDSPKDKFVWDTSHQCYVHKMLTGRLNEMFTVRQKGGLSGFANIFESKHDAFGAGHASTALSAGLGLAHSREVLKGDNFVVSIVGDSGLSGGMCYEALNNAEKIKSNFICIVNDNDMSISPPVGNMSHYMTKIRTSHMYDQARKMFDDFLTKIPKSGPLKRRIDKSIEHFRDIILDNKVGVIFEEFGFKYIGPIDGHNIPILMTALKYAKNYNGPIMIHIVTQKGKGHQPAELDPVKYHGIKPKAKPDKPVQKGNISSSDLFGKTMIDICNKRDDVVVITPAMIGGSGLTEFEKVHPTKLFDVGIAEEHAVTFAAGLSRGGAKPVLAIYSTFLQRGYDQLIHDVCLQKLPMVLALDRAGFAGEDGATHQGVFDYNYMLSIPNLTILAPKDGPEQEAMLRWAVDQDLTVSIRYPKGSVISRTDLPNLSFKELTSELLLENKENTNYDLCLIGVGSMAWPAYDAAKLLIEQFNLNICVINPRTIKPLDKHSLNAYISNSNYIMVVEEGQAIGGVFQHILSEFNDVAIPLNQWIHLAIPDQFVEHGSVEELKEEFDLTTEGIVSTVKKRLGLNY
jgi:1-deoxy-D-xylulose-5-phosphate synthase